MQPSEPNHPYSKIISYQMLPNTYIRFHSVSSPFSTTLGTRLLFPSYIRNPKPFVYKKTVKPISGTRLCVPSTSEIHSIQKEWKPILIPTLRFLLFNAYVSNSILLALVSYLPTGLQVLVSFLSFYCFSLQYFRTYLDTEEKTNWRNQANRSGITKTKVETKQLLPKTSVSKYI